MAWLDGLKGFGMEWFNKAVQRCIKFKEFISFYLFFFFAAVLFYFNQPVNIYSAEICGCRGFKREAENIKIYDVDDVLGFFFQV